MKILLAVDPPELNDAVIAEVAARPWPAGSTITVLCVVEAASVFDVHSLVEGLSEAAQDAVRSAAKSLNSSGLPATTLVQPGHPAEVILDQADELGADLIIVGSQGASGLARFVLGSVAAAVARFAPCSVEIMRPRETVKHPHPPMKVLLATDGSEHSQAAAWSIAERPWPVGTEFRVLSVAETSVPLLQLPYFSPSAMEKVRGEAMKRAEEAQMAAERVLSDAGLNESGTVAVPADTAKAIILRDAEEWGADLIVCGSHGRRGVNRFLLGSVSEAVATHAKCSVEIIRPKTKAG
jgi:nucleotide-binding universal stress UspA family protein